MCISTFAQNWLVVEHAADSGVDGGASLAGEDWWGFISGEDGGGED
jgi:hypothetical protein